MTAYDLLGLDREATDAQIRRAYRRLARRWHPDLNPGNAEAARQYAAITDAFETLVDPARRRAYDASGAAPSTTTAPSSSSFAGFDFSLRVQGAEASTFGDLFVDVFRDAAGSVASSARGDDLVIDLPLTLGDVLHGATRVLHVPRRSACGLCAGRGVLDAPVTPCRQCGGAGQVRLGRGHMVFVRPCERCNGAGQLRHRTCHGCHGHGQHDAIEPLAVTVPPGMSEGDVLVQPGAGHAGARGTAPGDLRVRLHVLPDAVWQRQGVDLVAALPIAVHEAVLGTRVEVETPDGVVSVRVPAGLSSGRRVRLRERGIPDRQTGRRGDLVLEIAIVLPPVIDARGRDLMREFARLHPEDVRQDWGGRASRDARPASADDQGPDGQHDRRVIAAAGSERPPRKAE